VVRAFGEPTEEQLAELMQGVELEDGKAKFESLVVTEGEGSNRSYRVSVSEGRNRIVRRLFEKIACRVNRLMRVSYGPIKLPRDLRSGKYRELSEREVELLMEAVKT
jgi:23S rRNA pseudouridine2605 synthase